MSNGKLHLNMLKGDPVFISNKCHKLHFTPYRRILDCRLFRSHGTITAYYLALYTISSFFNGREWRFSVMVKWVQGFNLDIHCQTKSNQRFRHDRFERQDFNLGIHCQTKSNQRFWHDKCERQGFILDIHCQIKSDQRLWLAYDKCDRYSKSSWL